MSTRRRPGQRGYKGPVHETVNRLTGGIARAGRKRRKTPNVSSSQTRARTYGSKSGRAHTAGSRQRNAIMSRRNRGYSAQGASEAERSRYYMSTLRSSAGMSGALKRLTGRVRHNNPGISKSQAKRRASRALSRR
jgi:hypothetical protein